MLQNKRATEQNVIFFFSKRGRKNKKQKEIKIMEGFSEQKQRLRYSLKDCVMKIVSIHTVKYDASKHKRVEHKNMMCKQPQRHEN